MAFISLHGGLPVPSTAVAFACQAWAVAGPSGICTVAQRFSAASPPPPVLTVHCKLGGAQIRIFTTSAPGAAVAP